jgi:hypothetical protein
VKRSRSRVTSVLLGVLLMTSIAAPAAALTPNDSVLFWKPGKAATGVLHNGVYTRKAAFSLDGVSLAAASRSSLALYTRDTGRLRTGTFRNGVYRPVETITVRTGFTHMVASCDTLLLYNGATGRTLVGTLVGGRFRDPTARNLGAGANRLAATCDGMIMLDIVGPDESSIRVFSLVAGRAAWEVDTGMSLGDPDLRLATTDDSYLVVVPSTAGATWFGIWGLVVPAANPPLQTVSQTSGFSDWRIVAGTASSLQFYRPDGLTCRWWLAAGGIQASSCAGRMSAGWKVIAGGR